MENGLVTSLLAVVLTRATERILLIPVGALAIYLGYCLFRLIPSSADSAGKVQLPGGISIFLTRIGPGVFFALFGAGLIGYSATRPVEFSIPAVISAVSPNLASEKTPHQAASQVGGVKYSGAMEMPASVGSLKPEDVVAKLNGYTEDVRARLDKAAAEEIAETIKAAKLAVMTSNWSAEWGDRAAFERWVREGAAADPPITEAPGAVVVFGTVLK
jgi:branched-subunit amino acid transport protein